MFCRQTAILAILAVVVANSGCTNAGFFSGVSVKVPDSLAPGERSQGVCHVTTHNEQGLPLTGAKGTATFSSDKGVKIEPAQATFQLDNKGGAAIKFTIAISEDATPGVERYSIAVSLEDGKKFKYDATILVK